MRRPHPLFAAYVAAAAAAIGVAFAAAPARPAWADVDGTQLETQAQLAELGRSSTRLNERADDLPQQPSATPSGAVRLHLQRAREAGERAAAAWARASVNLALLARLLREGRL